MIARPFMWIAAMVLFAAPPARADGISLSVTSPDGATAFTAECTITGPGGERTESYDQTTPLEAAFEAAKGLRCRVDSDGTIEVVVRGAGGNVSRSRTSGGTVTIAVGS